MSVNKPAAAKYGAIAEAARQAETLRYGASLLAESFINDTARPLHPALLRLSSDATLTAFAQLTTLRLRVDRALISLFDGKRQHIVAEATPSTPIDENPDEYSPDADVDGLVLSGTAIPRMHGSCEYVLDRPAVQEPSTPGCTMLPISVITDLTQDARFCTRPYFKPGSQLRFYAGVPLRTPQGIDIGVCCVYHSEPRDDLDAPARKFLRHTSRLVMAHLQSRISAESYRRHERMVRGLGSLIEGQGSMSNWRETQNPQSFLDIGDQEGKLNARQQYLQGQAGDNWSEQQQQQQQQQQPQPERPRLNSQQPTQEASKAGGPSGRTDAVDFENDEDRMQSRESVVSISDGLGADDGTASARGIFSRAANIIRESIEVQGSLFLDASIGSFGGLVPQRRPNSQDQSQTGSSSSSGNESILTDDSTAGMQYCQILGFSTSEMSSINGEAPPDAFRSIPDTFLEKILRRYPRGQVFNFDDAGAVIWPLSDSEGSESTAVSTDPGSTTTTKPAQRGGKRRPRRSDATILIKMFPGARSVGLFPVLDPHKERWYAGGFVWTNAASRVFSAEGEISYLLAFGAATMAEIARLEVSKENKAKEDILGSLSHEIRSPLHGVILGVELMHDTVLTAFQEDVLHTVETCGRTLLETLDHLLDFSKVNNFLRTPKRRGSLGRERGIGVDGIGRSHIEAGMMSIFSEVTLDLLLEEVVESVYAGHSFQNTSSNWAVRDRPNVSYFDHASTMRRIETVRQFDTPGSHGATSLSPPFLVGVFLSIDPNVAWNFRAQPGALRRVIMNILGNALKFTTQGSILVSLTQEPASTKRKNRWRTIILTISDSGRGISSDFLHNRLYSPFAQENQLSPGAGLGLSIVKQIVHGLGGRIAVESRLHHGTTVRVTIPLRRSSPRSSDEESGVPFNSNDDLEALIQELDGCSVCLIGFPENFGEHQPLAVAHRESAPCPRLLLQSMCERYLGLRTVAESEALVEPPTFFICTQDALSRVPHLDKMPPVVVACNSVLTAHELAAQHSPARSSVIECFSQPVGPRKLAKILAMTLRRYKDAQDSDPVFAPPSPIEAKVPEVTVSGREQIHPLGQRPPRDRSGSTPAIPLSAPTRAPRVGPISADRVADSGTIASFEARSPHTKDALRTPSSEENRGEKEDQDDSAYLLVDDNAINLKILASYMKKISRPYEQAVNGREAVDVCVARAIHYRCIFMDISMPIMDGLEATRLIRAHEQQNALKPALIIALTGLASAQTQQEAYASGIDLFLTKPVPLKELGRILQSKGV